MLKAFLLLSVFISSTVFASPLALVYEGPGSCAADDGDCTGAAVRAAVASGYEVKRVGPAALKPGANEAAYQTLFKNAALWVQPGGGSKSFLKAITPELRAAIRRFVSEGGGYVGYCAGAFSATEIDGTLLDVQGLGLFPGRTHSYPNQILNTFSDYVTTRFNPDAYSNHIFEVNWNGKLRSLYFEEGPFLNLDPETSKNVEVVARFRNQQIVSARTVFGKGRVYITGAHPEAPMSWRSHPDLRDPDGLDYDLVKEMMDWSARGSQKAFKPTPVAAVVPPATPNPGEFLGKSAIYETEFEPAGSHARTHFATTEMRITAYDSASRYYTIETKNTWADGKTDFKVTTIEESELKDHADNSFARHCEDYQGTVDSATGVCRISSSSITFSIGPSVFAIVGTDSVDSHGNHYITVLQR